MKRAAKDGRDQEPNKRSKSSRCSQLCHEVFSNGLILRKLEKLISYQDLKTCRLVCKSWNQSIIAESCFERRTEFSMKQKNVKDQLLDNISFPLKKVHVHPFYAYVVPTIDIDGGEDSETKKRIPRWRMKQEVEHVYGKCGSVEELKIARSSKGKLFPMYPSIKQIIKRASNLQKISMKFSDIRYVLGRCSQAMRSSLNNVVDIEVLSSGLLELPVVTASLIAKVVPKLKNLKRVKIFEGQYSKGLLPLVIANHETIEHLTFFGWRRPGCAALADVSFPKLRELHLRLYSHYDQVYIFLQNHRNQLEKITLCVMGTFPPTFLDFLQSIKTQLKYLRLEMKNFDDSTTDPLNFLNECKNLEEFHMTLLPTYTLTPNDDDLGKVLEHVPTSVKKLSLVRISRGLSARNLELRILTPSKVASLVNLTSLKITLSFEHVKKSCLRAVFRHLTKLRELEIIGTKTTLVHNAYSRSLDFWYDELGFSARNSVQISNLKALEKLTLRKCGIGNKILKKAFKFQNLEFLDLRGNVGVAFSALEGLLSQNPALEILRVDRMTGFTEEAVLNWKRRFPRFRFFQVPTEIESFDDNDSSDGSDNYSDEHESESEDASSGAEFFDSFSEQMGDSDRESFEVY